MTTLVSDIIRDAYRESNLISIGSEPSGTQREEAIRFINRLIPSVLGYEAGENLSNTYFNGDGSFDVNNTRLILGDYRPSYVTLPFVYRDGMRFGITDAKGDLGAYPLTIYGGPNQIDGSDFVTLQEPFSSVEYFYRADIGNWMRMSPVGETDIWPFPVEFDDMFVVTLAFRLNPRYNVSSQSESLMMLKRSERQFRARYRQTEEVSSDLALLNLRGSPYSGFSGFERGSV